MNQINSGKEELVNRINEMSWIENQSRKIIPGQEYTFYLCYCTTCGIYKKILTSPPAGPGGTLSCPYCKQSKMTFPGIEHAYGNVKTKTFKTIIPFL